jgi:aryl-alcohol dehydrogenase
MTVAAVVEEAGGEFALQDVDIGELRGAFPFGTDVGLDVNELIALGRRVRGIVEGESGPHVFIPQLAELWRQGRFPIDRLVSTFRFDEINVAVTAMEAGDVIKPVVLFH